MLQRRLATTWNDVQLRWRNDTAADNAAANYAATNNASPAFGRFGFWRRVRGRGSICRDGRRHVLQRWLATAWNDVQLRWRNDTAADNAATDHAATNAAAEHKSGRVRDARSVRHSRWWHLLQRWMAAARYGVQRRAAGVHDPTACVPTRIGWRVHRR